MRGTRPRKAGANARLGEHGIAMPLPNARFWTEDGRGGFGRANLAKKTAQTLIGLRLEEPVLRAAVAESGWELSI